MTLQPDQLALVDKIAEQLRRANSVLFVTGAGISADSGLPTYRGIGGLYNGGQTEEGIAIEDAISGQMLQTRPEITWKYLKQIEFNCRRATFNRGHEILAEMERHYKRVWVLTQNIDGLHRAAGTRNLIDIHGDLHALSCMGCGMRLHVDSYEQLEELPKCPGCAQLLRPEVVLFGEYLPEEKCELLEEELSKGFDMVFSIGTTSVFPYISGPVYLAKRWGVPSVEINPGTTSVSAMVDYKLSAGSSQVLEALWRKVTTSL